jgi:hypothetical protein
MAKDARIRALERELEVTKKLAKENEAARKTAEEQAEKMHEEFGDYQKRKRDEHKKVVAGAQRAANVYKELIESVGEESEAPRDGPVVDFMEWLANKLATMSDYMTISQEYASFVSLRALAQALEECGCDHLEKFEIKDP